jgi:hypothetical protein
MSETDDRRVLQAYRDASALLDEEPAQAGRAAILAAATRAAGARPQAVGRPRRWRLPLAAAASALVGTIAVLLATQVQREAPRELAQSEAVAPAAPAPSAPAPADRALSMEAPPAAKAPGPGAASAPPALRDRSAASLAGTRPGKGTATAAPPADGPASLAEPPSRERDVSERSQLAAPPVARQAAPALAAASPPADHVTQKAEVSERSQPAFSAPAGEVAAASAAPAPAANAGVHSDPQRIHPSGAALTSRAAGRAAAESRADVAAEEPAPWRTTPEAWLQRIVRLRADGRHGEANVELAALRERHPHLRIPEAALPPSGR